MSLAIIHSRATLGLEAPAVTIEVHLSNGLPGFAIVGLPDAAVRESKERVRSAILNSELDFPARRITVNLAPADLPKDGGRFDLAIAVGILVASGQIEGHGLHNLEFIGELALSGETRHTPASLTAAIAAHKAGRSLFLPSASIQEAALCQSATLYAAKHLLEVCAHLNRLTLLTPAKMPEVSEAADTRFNLDIAEVKGQETAKRALTVAAAGHHNLLMVGPPGSGKSMLASRLPSILPPLSEQEQLEIMALASISQQSRHDHSHSPLYRPFRAPHHTASSAALAGGGSVPKPGEISLAHHGVLFLDH